MTQTGPDAAPLGRPPAERQPAGDQGTAHYLDLFQQAPVGYCILDDQGRVQEANATLASLLGWAPDARVPHPLSAFILMEDHARFSRFLRDLAETGAPQACELRLQKQNGTVLWAHLAASRGLGADGAPACRLAVTDLTPQKRLELSLHRLYVVLAQVNQAIVHYRDRNELFRAVCRIAVKFGDFRLAWIGWVDLATGQVKPIAHDGIEEGYLQAIHINVDPRSAFSQVPSAQAILHNRIHVVGDYESAPQSSPWRLEALKRGYRATLAVPFRQADMAIGTLNLYTDAPASYSPEELDLLGRIGDALSFALDCFEIESRRQQAEAALRTSEAQNRAFIHAIPDLVFMNSRDGEYLMVHAPSPHLLAAPADSILHHKIGEFLPKPIARRCLAAIATALDSRVPRKLTYLLVVDGRQRRFEARIAPCTADTVLTIVRDITELAPPPRRPKAAPRPPRGSPHR